MRKIIIIMSFVGLGMLTFVGCKKEEVDIEEELNVSMEKQVETVDISAETIALEGDGGGNEFINESETEKVKEVAILVNNDEYIYENAPITLDEIVSMLEESESVPVVEITDNNATHKAYDRLVNKLMELEVTFMEQ